jgi:hypothetical protein
MARNMMIDSELRIPSNAQVCAWPSQTRTRLSGPNWMRATLVALVLLGGFANLLARGETGNRRHVSGGGKTIIEGGTGGSSPTPVTTLLAFHADADGGDFECLAFAPSTATGAGSGNFDANVMYVTGAVTSLQVEDGAAIVRGIATVTGIGAGQNVPFTATVHAGGPGTTVVLKISGLTFREILVEGRISFSREQED